MCASIYKIRVCLPTKIFVCAQHTARRHYSAFGSRGHRGRYIAAGSMRTLTCQGVPACSAGDHDAAATATQAGLPHAAGLALDAVDLAEELRSPVPTLQDVPPFMRAMKAGLANPRRPARLPSWMALADQQRLTGARVTGHMAASTVRRELATCTHGCLVNSHSSGGCHHTAPTSNAACCAPPCALSASAHLPDAASSSTRSAIFGDHALACPRTGVVDSASWQVKVVERAVRVAREAVGADGQVGSNNRSPDAASTWRPTEQSPCTRTGQPQPCAAAHDSAMLRVAERRMLSRSNSSYSAPSADIRPNHPPVPIRAAGESRDGRPGCTFMRLSRPRKTVCLGEAAQGGPGVASLRKVVVWPAGHVLLVGRGRVLPRHPASRRLRARRCISPGAVRAGTTRCNTMLSPARTRLFAITITSSPFLADLHDVTSSDRARTSLDTTVEEAATHSGTKRDPQSHQNKKKNRSTLARPNGFLSICTRHWPHQTDSRACAYSTATANGFQSICTLGWPHQTDSRTSVYCTGHTKCFSRAFVYCTGHTKLYTALGAFVYCTGHTKRIP